MNASAGKITNVRFKNRNGCRLYGQNVGDFPKHHFSYLISPIPPENWALQVSFAGPDETVSGFWRARENSDLFSLELIQSGTYEFTQNEKKYDCVPGDLFLVQPGGNSCMRTTSGYSVKKTVSIAGTSLTAILNSLNLAQVDVIRNVPDRIEGIFDTIFQLMEKRPEHYLHDLSVQAFHLLLELSERCESQEYPELLNRMLSYLEGCFGSPITIEHLSRRFGVSSGTVFRLFRDHLKTSPIDYIIRLRMRHARCLLLEEKYSIKDIADRVGYRNQLYFSGEFHRICGMSPREFRKKHINY